MTAIVVGMVLIVILALIVISMFSHDEEDDWSRKRPGRPDPDEGTLDDLLDE